MHPHRKTSLESLSELPQIDWREGQEVPFASTLLRYTERGRCFDYLFHPNLEHNNRLFVFFSGDALRKRFKPPVFQRWTWAKYFPGHCLYVSDPCLYMKHDLGLGWYCGTESFDVMESIAKRVAAVRDQLNIAPDQVCSYGSSAGGFAALRFLTFAKGATAIAVNPQVQICKYRFNAVEKYLDLCFGGISRESAERLFPRRFSLCHNADILERRRILLVQNTLDLHHFEDHYKPLCIALGQTSEHSIGEGSFQRFLFSDERGHAVAEPPVIFERILEIIKSNNY